MAAFVHGQHDISAPLHGTACSRLLANNLKATAIITQNDVNNMRLLVAAQAFVGLNTSIRQCEDQVLLAADTTVSAFLRTDIDLVKCLADLADCHRHAGGVCFRCCAPAELQSCCHGSLHADAMSDVSWALSTAPYGGVGSALNHTMRE
jgi:hypothetical protein